MGNLVYITGAPRCGKTTLANHIANENTSILSLDALSKSIRVTVIIRTRQKCSIKAIFVAFAVALRIARLPSQDAKSHLYSKHF